MYYNLAEIAINKTRGAKNKNSRNEEVKSFGELFLNNTVNPHNDRYHYTMYDQEATYITVLLWCRPRLWVHTVIAQRWACVCWTRATVHHVFGQNFGTECQGRTSHPLNVEIWNLLDIEWWLELGDCEGGCEGEYDGRLVCLEVGLHVQAIELTTFEIAWSSCSKKDSCI